MKIKKWLIPAAFCLLLGGLQTSTVAFARGRGGGMRAPHSRLGEAHERFRGGYRGGDFGRVIRPRVFIEPSLGWYWGYGWNYPWIWDPYYYPGPESVEVRHVDYGTLEFKVKPEDTKIYVDSKFIGTVKSLDHHQAYMKQGNHEIKLEAPDGGTMDRTIYVAAGKKIKLVENL